MENEFSMQRHLLLMGNKLCKGQIGSIIPSLSDEMIMLYLILNYLSRTCQNT